MRPEFPVIVSGIVTSRGDVLIGQKEEKEGHPISGEWHFPGGYLEEGEDLEEALQREIEEETGLEITIHHLVDAYYDDHGEIIRVIYHCEAEKRDAEPMDDLQEVRWVSPEDLEDALEGDIEARIALRRSRVKNLVEKLKKMPRGV